MEERKKESNTYVRARKRVERIKAFYWHLWIYSIANALLFILKGYILGYLSSHGFEDEGFLNWFGLNIILTPMLWGIGLLVHGLVVFKFDSFSIRNLKPKFIKNWEERQIKKYIETDQKRSEEL